MKHLDSRVVNLAIIISFEPFVSEKQIIFGSATTTTKIKYDWWLLNTEFVILENVQFDIVLEIVILHIDSFMI